MSDQLSTRPSLARLALGTAVLAAERLRLVERPAPDIGPLEQPSAFAVAVGLAQQGADVARDRIAQARRTTRSLADRVGARVRPPAPLSRVRKLIDSSGARGQQVLRTSRTSALAELSTARDEGIKWAETTAVPRIVDDMMPYLLNDLIPRLVEGALPEIRRRVIPVIIEDLTSDPRVREMIAVQGRGVLSDATDELRETSASADDAVENTFRRLLNLPNGHR